MPASSSPREMQLPILRIRKENIHILNGNAEDLEAECANYEKQIESFGGIDLFLATLLGLSKVT